MKFGHVAKYSDRQLIYCALRRLALSGLFIIGTVGAVVSDDGKRIAFSERLGVEILAKSVDGGNTWCTNNVSLNFVADYSKFFQTNAFPDLVSKLGIILKKECPQAIGAEIQGLLSTGSRVLYGGNAQASNAWILENFRTITSTDVISTPTPTVVPPPPAPTETYLTFFPSPRRKLPGKRSADLSIAPVGMIIPASDEGPVTELWDGTIARTPIAYSQTVRGAISFSVKHLDEKGPWCSEVVNFEITAPNWQFFKGGMVNPYLPEIGAFLDKECNEARGATFVSLDPVMMGEFDQWKAVKDGGWKLADSPDFIPEYVYPTWFVSDGQSHPTTAQAQSILQLKAPEEKAVISDAASNQARMSRELREGPDSSSHIREAHDLAISAAKAGDTDGMYLAGIDFLVGNGIEKDLSQAIHYLEKAAVSGHRGAIYAAGLALKQAGRFMDAASWFWKGSLQTDELGALCDFQLALMSYNGDHRQKDLLVAYSYFAEAARKGSKEAIMYKAAMAISQECKGCLARSGTNATFVLSPLMDDADPNIVKEATKLYDVQVALMDAPSRTEMDMMGVLAMAALYFYGMSAGAPSADSNCDAAASALGGCDPTHIGISYLAYFP